MPKRTPLVCQHLENVSREVLEKYQEIVRQYVRKRQGVYALYRRGKLYYVGLASNLRSRLAHHLKDRHHGSWDRFSVYLTIGDSHLRELEALILRIVKPAGNKQKGKLPRSEDIRRAFVRGMRQRQKDELRALVGRETLRVEGTTEEEVDDGRRPVLAGYFQGRAKLITTYKGKRITARVRRDGKIRFAGKLYNSPSLAGAAACKRRTCNGWTFWQYERAPGDWVMLDCLRK